MQIRCFKCNMPIAMSKDAILTALDYVTDEELTHYDIRCPRCRKVNRVSVKQLHQAAPNWEREREGSDSSES